MELVNASGWPAALSLSEHQSGFFSGSYPGETPRQWRDHPLPFAYVRYDRKRQHIIAVRDHFGCEPCYFYFNAARQQFIFASNLPAIIKHLDSHPAWNNERILIECFAKNPLFASQYSNETFLQGIYRVEAGHSLTIHADGSMVNDAYWQLSPDCDSLYYAKSEDYLEHFSALLQEAVSVQTKHTTSFAAELSGGLDSSSVVIACQQLGLQPELFSHVAPLGASVTDDLMQVQALVQHLGLTKIHYVDAKEFDLLASFQTGAELFAGAPCYVFPMLAGNLHQAVVARGHTTLLSGFGGDECASSFGRAGSYFPALLKQGSYRLAWYEMICQLRKTTDISPSQIKIFLQLLRLSHPTLFRGFSQVSNLKQVIKAFVQRQPRSPLTQDYGYYPSVRHFEYAQLQGDLCQHLRMRIEHSAVRAKQWGFQYAYPLLYPKLVEFCFRLPPEQKRRHGINRYLMRQYLARYAPSIVAEHNCKRGSILPATSDLYKKNLQRGTFDKLFEALPFQAIITDLPQQHQQDMVKILAYMFQFYSDSSGIVHPKA